MRSSMIGLLAFGVAVAIQGCGGTTTDSGGAGTGSGGKQGVGGSSGSKNTGGAPGVGGTTGSVGGSGGDPGTGGVPPTGGAGGAPGVGGAGGGGTCAPPSCAGCFDCFSSCFCQTSAAEECKLACSGGTGGAGGAPASCDELTKEVYARLDAAKACCPFCDSIQCTGSVPGLCCPETVGNANSGETQSYLEALKRLQGSNCSVACPAIPCGPAEPSYNCVPGPAGNGRCQ